MKHAYRWLAVLPALAILGGVPFANQVHPYVLGLPFLLAWILGCVVLTSAVMALVAFLDLRHGPTAPADGAGAAAPAGPGGELPPDTR